MHFEVSRVHIKLDEIYFSYTYSILFIQTVRFIFIRNSKKKKLNITFLFNLFKQCSHNRK